MSEITTGEKHERDNQGRFLPGESGNPSGRPPGRPDRRTALRNQLLGPLLNKAVERLSEALEAGERWAIELVVTYTLPKPRPVDPDEVQEFEERLRRIESRRDIP